MNIAYLANIRFPSERAHSVQIAHMCQAFADNGANVELIVNNRTKFTKSETDRYFQMDTKFTTSRIPAGYFNPKIRITFYLSEFIYSLCFFLRKDKRQYDVIYCRSEWAVWFISFVFSRDYLIWESHEAKLNFPAKRIIKKGIKIIVISEGIFEEYQRLGVSTKQMLIAHDGIDESFFGNIETKQVARQRLGLPLDKIIAMYIGGFDEWKGVETFFAAASFADDILFVAVGGSKEQVSLFSKKYPSVTFLGQLPYADLKNNQQAADVLVIPNSAKNNLSLKYTSPLKLFAHMASGVPLVASDIPSIVNVTGQEFLSLVSPDNAKALALQIEDVFQNYEEKSRHAQALKTLSLRYTWKERATDILTFINLKKQS